MTPEQEYEEAERLLATLLWSRIGGDPLKSLGIIVTLINLTWPSGQPMVAVMAKDQSFRALTALMPPERKIGFDLAVGEMKEAGFRRVVKQEAKK